MGHQIILIMIQSKNFSINDTIDGISNYAPLVMFVMMVVMFCLTGLMQHLFLDESMEAVPGGIYVAFLFPIIIQVLRFVTGFLSASFFKKKRWILGVFVLLFSVWLSVFEYQTVDEMVLLWTQLDLSLEPITHSELKIAITKEVLRGVMNVLIWGALILEIFLAAWLVHIPLALTPLIR